MLRLAIGAQLDGITMYVVYVVIFFSQLPINKVWHINTFQTEMKISKTVTAKPVEGGGEGERRRDEEEKEKGGGMRRRRLRKRRRSGEGRTRTRSCRGAGGVERDVSVIMVFTPRRQHDISISGTITFQ